MIYLDLPKEFHRAFLVPTARTFEDATNEAAILRRTLLDEEYREYYSTATPLLQLDALCDMMYIVGGTLDVLGIKYVFARPQNTLPALVGSLLIELNKPAMCHNGIQYNACALIPSIEVEGNKLGVFTAAFQEVHRSNMTKMPANKIPLRRQDGKILKPETYSPPALAQFLYSPSDLTPPPS